MIIVFITNYYAGRPWTYDRQVRRYTPPSDTTNSNTINAVILTTAGYRKWICITKPNLEHFVTVEHSCNNKQHVFGHISLYQFQCTWSNVVTGNSSKFQSSENYTVKR